MPTKGKGKGDNPGPTRSRRHCIPHSPSHSSTLASPASSVSPAFRRSQSHHQSGGGTRSPPFTSLFCIAATAIPVILLCLSRGHFLAPRFSFFLYPQQSSQFSNMTPAQQDGKVTSDLSDACDGLPCSPSPHETPRRVLFLTLEYKAGTFSGNGIYSQSVVRSLSALGHAVFVISAGPESATQGAHPRRTVDHELIEIPVPVWGRLDWHCSWEPFASGITAGIAARAALFKPEWVLVVDWSALEAYRALSRHKEAWEGATWMLPRMTYLNFRVYTLSEYKGEQAAEEKEFYQKKEGEAVREAWAIAALSSRDAHFLQHDLGVQRPSSAPVARALLPPLREDMRQIALRQREEAPKRREGTTPPRRKYLSSCVRLSPEKNADLFASLVEHLAPFLESHSVVPLLCTGAHKEGDGYAQGVKERVRRACPGALILEGFQGPDRMGELYAQTLLNIHPCLYDAYGMTMVEAAAFGAPSLVNVGSSGAVGATELLDPDQGMAVAVDLAQDLTHIAEKIKEILSDVNKLASIGQAAQEKSLSWSEEANARALTMIVEASLAME